MKQKQIVYTEIRNGTPKPERWYYGCYEDRDYANEVAQDLGSDYSESHSVCILEDAKNLNIKNLPFWL